MTFGGRAFRVAGLAVWNSLQAVWQISGRLGARARGKSQPILDYRAYRVPELIPVLGSLPAGDVSHKPGGRLPFLSARPAVTPAILKTAATNLLLGEQRHGGCEQFA